MLVCILKIIISTDPKASRRITQGAREATAVQILCKEKRKWTEKANFTYSIVINIGVLICFKFLPL